MPRRLLSYFLALLTLWSALATQEPVAVSDRLVETDGVTGLAVESFREPAQPRLQVGSVADHHLDDQAHGEAPADLDGLPPAERRFLTCSLETPVPLQQIARQLPTPYLDGLRRPPRVPSLLS